MNLDHEGKVFKKILLPESCESCIEKTAVDTNSHNKSFPKNVKRAAVGNNDVLLKESALLNGLRYSAEESARVS
jgi:hypothetical protein